MSAHLRRWLAISHDRWRADLLTLSLKASLVVGAAALLPAVYAALQRSDASVVAVDLAAIAAAFALFRSMTRERDRAEAALRDHERRFRALIEHSADSVALTDAAGKVLYLSPAVRAVEGYAPEELVGRSGFENTHPDDVSTVAAVARDLIASPGKSVPVLWRRRHKDGHWMWLEGVATNLLDDPAVRAIVTNYRDVTDRLAAEAALRASEERQRLLNALSDAARSAATPDDVIAASVAIFGKHLRASRCAYAYLDEDGESFVVQRDYVDGCRSSAGRYRLADFGQCVETEIRAGRTLVIRDAVAELAPEDGRAAFVANDIRALICCSLVRDGRLVAMLGVHQTTPRDWKAAEVELLESVVERCWAAVERRAYEERLRRSEQHLRAVIDTTPECVALIAPDGTVREMNPVGLAMKEAATPEEIIGKGIGEFIAPEDRARVADFHAAVCAGRGGRITFDIVGLRGTRRTMETIGAPLAGADGRLMHLAIARDATETRLLEEQLRQSQKMEAVGRLAGGVAHDFNNLLTIVIGYCDLLADKRVLPLEDQELLAEVRRSGERAAALTRQLLAFSRKQVLAPRVLSLNATVGDMERMLGRLIGEDIGLTCSLDEALWPVRVDPGQVEQVIVNLAVNARDAMPHGGELIIETKNVEWTGEQCRGHADRVPGRYAAVSITDTGAGIAPEIKQRIFEPFFTTKEPGKGTGLGLSVVHGIVKQSEGFIEVHSEPGCGASFVSYFPAVAAPLEPVDERAAQDPVPRGSERVLIVEDEEAVRTLLERALAKQGYDVVAAADGRAALEAVERRGLVVDLVVTDVVMPRASGRELVDALRRRLPALRVLFISGYTDDSGIRHAVHDARFAFLQKPFSPVALIRKVRQVLDADAGGCRVLLVDDESALVYLAGRALEERGYRVNGCSSAAEALAAFKRDPLGVDLLVTDAKLQGMSGLELLEEMHALRPELRALLMSGSVDEELRARAAAAGAAAVLCKPGTVGELAASIDREALAAPHELKRRPGRA